MKLASIDIGTNTILMTISEYDEVNNRLIILKDIHNVARLGEGVDNNKYICDAAIERARAILNEYKQICVADGVHHILACATSAMRDAQNSKDVIDIFSSILDSQVEIIAGELEAKLSFIGTIDSNKLSAVIDIGGGSTEICFGKNGKVINRISLNFGAVRILERYFKILPPKDESVLKSKEFINKLLKSLSPENNNYDIYAVAGTATSLASIDLSLETFSAKSIHNYILSFEKVKYYSEMLLKKSHSELIAIPGMHPQRADLMPAGALILKSIMQYLIKDNVIVSIRGLRYGILKELAFRNFGTENIDINLDSILNKDFE